MTKLEDFGEVCWKELRLLGLRRRRISKPVAQLGFEYAVAEHRRLYYAGEFAKAERLRCHANRIYQRLTRHEHPAVRGCPPLDWEMGIDP